VKGIVCQQIEQFRLVELEEPVRLPGEAIVSIRRIGICGTDLHAFKGNQPFFTYPRILGHELAGVVEEVDVDETTLRVGDPVSIIPYLHCGSCVACRHGKTNCCTAMKVLGVHVDGGMRERISVPTSHLIKTEGLTHTQSAMLEPFSIGAHAVRRSGLQAGEVALVIGAGPIGLGVMAFAKLRGAKVIAMDVKDERLAFCSEWANVDHTVNALQQPSERLAALTGGDMPTVVFDATGSAKSMSDSFGLVAHGGRLVFVGLVKADIAFNDPDFHKRELTLMSSRNATREDFEQVKQAVMSGSIDVNRYVTHQAPFEQMIERFGDWMRPEMNVIKAVLTLE
jgi:2-desacetyl-2-hydroxyethyl bacteriochlorophyllide A dehydrogenase